MIKVGETSIIYESTNLYKELKITITENKKEKEKIDNPKTTLKQELFS